MKKFVIAAWIFMFGFYSMAQGGIKGTIPGWSLGAGQVGVMSMGPPEIVGSFDAQGNVEIPLKPDALTEVKKQMEEANQGSTDGWTASLPMLGDRFSCFGGALEVTGGEQPITGLGGPMGFLLVNMDQKKSFGYLQIASSKEFVEGMQPYIFKPGYSLEWYYVEQDASVKGTCNMESYAVNQKDLYTQSTSYDLDLKKGWNLIRYEIHEVYTDGEGNSYPMQDSYTTLTAMPSGVQFVFLED